MDEDAEVLFWHYETGSGWPLCGLNDNSISRVLTTDWNRVGCALCKHDRHYCQHLYFDESMDGSMKCRDCGLEAHTCHMCGGGVLSQTDDAGCGHHTLEA